MKAVWRNEKTIIYNNGSMNSGFSERYSVGNIRDSYHDMIINNSRQSDSGIYECIGDNGNGRSQLIILDVSGNFNRSRPIIGLFIIF
jgi:hypothetical protein